MWFKKRKSEEYSKDLVKYLLNKILTETVDRDLLLELMIDELEPIIGKSVINQFYAKLNELERDLDKRKIDYWMRKAEEADQEKVFDN